MKRILCLMIILVCFGCASQEMLRVRQLEIIDINLGCIPDGDYIGAFSYGGFEYKVKTAVGGHQIVNIEVIQNRKTKYAKRAEGVILRIIERQTPNVDTVSGATTTSTSDNESRRKFTAV